MCTRVNVALRLSPTALIGRKLRIYWPDDDGWYLGTAVQYLPQSGQHKVAYVIKKQAMVLCVC